MPPLVHASPSAPLVSVLMVAHDAGEHLGPAVRSILAQTHAALELVLIDNASTDGSVARLARAVPDARLRRHGLPENLGQLGGWRAGLPQCAGEFVAFMDADDIALPQRLETQLAWLRSNPGFDLAVTLAEEIDAAGRRLGPAFTARTEDQIRAFAEFDNPVRLNTGLARRAFVERVGFSADDSWAHDYQFVVDALAIGRVGCVPEVLNLYRVHGSSMTGRNRPRQAGAAAVVSWQAACRRRGRPDLMPAAPHFDWDAATPDLRAVHAVFLRRALAAGLPALAIFHARRAHSVWGLARGLLAALGQRQRLGFLLRLAWAGPVRAAGMAGPPKFHG